MKPTNAEYMAARKRKLMEEGRCTNCMQVKAGADKGDPRQQCSACREAKSQAVADTNRRSIERRRNAYLARLEQEKAATAKPKGKGSRTIHLPVPPDDVLEPDDFAHYPFTDDDEEDAKVVGRMVDLITRKRPTSS